MYVDTDLVWLIMPHTMHPLFAFTMHARVCRASPQSLSASLSPHEIYATWLRKYGNIRQYWRICMSGLRVLGDIARR